MKLVTNQARNLRAPNATNSDAGDGPNSAAESGAANGSLTLVGRLLSELEAAKVLSISPRKLFDKRKLGNVKCVRIGRRVLYDETDLIAYITSRKSGV